VRDQVFSLCPTAGIGITHLGEDSLAVENGYEIPAEPGGFFAMEMLDGR
jgi:hypothetical protein